MAKFVFAAAAAVAWGVSVTPGAAQLRLRLNVVDALGAATLDQGGYGCFDPLAALRFDADVTAGRVSDETRDAFAVGSCVVLPEGLELIGAARVSLEDQIFVRGDIVDSGVTAYIPDWSASVAGADDGYNSTLVAQSAAVDETAADLLAMIVEYRQCERAGAALEAQIINYNERAEAADPRRAPTGSRFSNSGAAPVFQIVMPDEEYRALFFEAEALQAEVNAFWAECAAYRKNITLDKDYLAFFEAVG